MNTQKNIKVNDKEFVITKLNALDQMDLLISLSSLLSSDSIFSGNGSNMIISGLLKSLSSFDEKKRKELFESTLSNVYYKSKDGVYPVYSNGLCNYDDLDWADLVGLIIANIMFNLGNFSQALNKIGKLTGISVLEKIDLSIDLETSK